MMALVTNMARIALIVSIPPMAALFFNGTMGQFHFSSAFDAGGSRAAVPDLHCEVRQVIVSGDA